MTLYEFNALDMVEQAETLWQGAFIDNREDSKHRILLYQIDSFYVEVYYHLQDNEIIRFRSFSNTSQLDPYLSNLDIDNLIGDD